jgi:hypothetical protein
VKSEGRRFRDRQTLPVKAPLRHSAWSSTLRTSARNSPSVLYFREEYVPDDSEGCQLTLRAEASPVLHEAGEPDAKPRSIQ